MSVCNLTGCFRVPDLSYTAALGLENNMKFSCYSNKNIPEVIDQHHNKSFALVFIPLSGFDDCNDHISLWGSNLHSSTYHTQYLLNYVECCDFIIRNYYMCNCICIFHFCSTTVMNVIYTKLNVCVCRLLIWKMLWRTKMGFVAYLD